MTRVLPHHRTGGALLAGWRHRSLSFKAIAFAFVGVINTAIDYSVFLAARAALDGSPAAVAALASLTGFCRCGSAAAAALIAANTMSWFVAVSCSYVMNSSITFAAETGRKLRWRAYFAFVASGVAGWLANTVTLLVAAQSLLLPVWAAKAVAILAGFVVNFALSHFVVFRVRAEPAADIGKDA